MKGLHYLPALPKTPFDPLAIDFAEKEKAKEAYARLDDITNLQDLIDLENMFIHWNSLIQQAHRKHVGIFIPGRKPMNYFQLELKAINDKIEMVEDATVPNKRLLDQKGPLGRVRWSCFIQIVEQKCFTQFPVISNAEFATWLDNGLCTDWSKMDLEGESFGGFYLFPEGSEEKKNAYTLTRETAIAKLVKLKFPRELIKMLINYGCNTRQESYRWIKNACIWFHRMIHATQILTLQRTIVYQMNCRHE